MDQHPAGTGHRMARELSVMPLPVRVPARDVKSLALDLHRLIGRPAAVEQQGFLEASGPPLRTLAFENEAEVPERQRERADVAEAGRVLGGRYDRANRRAFARCDHADL